MGTFILKVNARQWYTKYFVETLGKEIQVTYEDK